MKKVVFILLALYCSLNVLASDELKKEDERKFSLKDFSIMGKLIKADSIFRQQKLICNVCCTFTATSMDGQQTVSQTACAGWIFTSCETAGARACERARIAAVYAVF
ncbi:MAG: hypothetical protein IPK31_03285 [Chitinophagaceae bacterium]|nr:hypothetical protein [Chitinophagaceae bacterium]